jgi:Ser/Thr protein kinase RdoA (MazF antagonist)
MNQLPPQTHSSGLSNSDECVDFSFANLNPDVILDALESIDIQVATGLLALNSYENRVYQFADDHQRYVVKFYRSGRWTDAQIQEEHDFALELASNEIPLVAPCVINGNTLHHYQDTRFALFPSVGGRQFEVDNLDQLEWMGRFIGRMHRVAQSSPFVYRAPLNASTHLQTPLIQLQHSQLVPSHLQTAFFAILNPVIEATTELYQPKNELIRLHGDCHPGNILWRDGPSFVDLDDCRMGPAVQDLWMMLSGDKHQQFIQLDTLIEAYDEFHTFAPEQTQLIEPLRAMRMVHYMAWLSERWQDPAFPQAFPWFAEDKYWEGQILALKEQMSALQEAPIRL